MKEKIEKILDKIRPHLKNDGGDVEFVSFDQKKGLLTVRLKGACYGCPMSQMTLQNGIARLIKEELKEVKEVIAA